uniref:NR LBD domain-containing protein n=1 Tax=Heterorhabditis bacteriophora TaxID=37862 RepID=A0A1I7X7H6_HETBA
MYADMTVNVQSLQLAAGRNACRFCRFSRCLNSGMKLEAVRLDKKNDKMTKRKKAEVDSDDYNEDQENIESLSTKRMCMDNRLLTTSLLLIDKTATHSSRKQPLRTTMLTLAMAMEESDLLDGDRTEMSFRVSSRADSDACMESERRLLTWAIDWTRQVADMEDAISNTDKIALLRACWASLTLLELGARSCKGAATVLPLPNNTFLHADIPPPQNCFLNAKVLYSLLKWSHCDLKQLSLSAKELVLLKAIVVLNPDAPGLSPRAQSAVSALRDRVHSALYQHCVSLIDSYKAAHRLAKVLLLIPQLTLMAVEVVEHLRLRHTFIAHPKLIDPLLFQLYGDIFEEGKTEEAYLVLV